jgi:hypothetical protein
VFTKSCTALLRALLMVSRVDLAVAMFPGVIAAPLVLGTIAGSGGKFIVDAMKFGWGNMPGRAEMTEPGFTSRSAFVASAAYYILAHGAGLVEPRAAAGLVVTALMVHTGLTEPLGRPLDFTEPIAQAVHMIWWAGGGEGGWGPGAGALVGPRLHEGSAQRGREGRVAPARGRGAAPRSMLPLRAPATLHQNPPRAPCPLAPSCRSFVPRPGELIVAAATTAAKASTPAATPSKAVRRATAVGGSGADAGGETPLTGLTKPAARRSGRVAAAKSS